MNRYTKNNKTFLSDNKSEYGSICWATGTKDHIKDYPVDEGCIPNRWGEVRITDCSKAIELDFWYNTEEGFKERLAKLDLLVSELLKFREAFIEMYNKELVIEVTEEKEDGKCLRSSSLKRIMDM